MADSKQSFWSYLWDQVKQWFKSVKDTWNWLVRGVTNKVAGHDWSEDNQSLWNIITWRTTSQPVQADSISTNKATLNQVAAWLASSDAQADISAPQNLLWTNADLEQNVTLNDVVKSNLE